MKKHHGGRVEYGCKTEQGPPPSFIPYISIDTGLERIELVSNKVFYDLAEAREFCMDIYFALSGKQRNLKIDREGNA